MWPLFKFTTVHNWSWLVSTISRPRMNINLMNDWISQINFNLKILFKETNRNQVMKSLASNSLPPPASSDFFFLKWLHGSELNLYTNYKLYYIRCWLQNLYSVLTSKLAPSPLWPCFQNHMKSVTSSLDFDWSPN